MEATLKVLLIVALSTFAAAETCVNLSGDENCKFWQEKGYCAETSDYRSFMVESCKKACKLCGDCIDNTQYLVQCPLWKSAGYCSKNSQHYQFMKQQCSLECGICTLTKKESVSSCSDSGKYDKCSFWKEYGLCKETSQHYGFMKDHCSKTCGFCAEECKDIEDVTYCNKYKPYCKHSTIGDTVSHNCKKTCEACSAPLVCGQGFAPGGRVVGGVNAEKDSWPWQAAIKVNGALFCGGTLIAKKWVLTAGHCLVKGGALVQEGDLEVILGEYDRNKVEGTEQTFRVLRIVRHPQYNPTTKDSDIALLELNKEATLNKYVGVACLPTEEPKIKLESTCYITGFGKTSGEGPAAVILQQAKLPVVTNKECSILNKHPAVTSNMLCAGHGLDFTHNQSGCRGDSGGPFVCEKNGTWQVQGVVSWGSARCISGENFTVFARVLKFIDWIKKTIG